MIVFSIIALVAMIFAIICFVSSIDSYREHVELLSYGGDAYTGIQNAAADTANNVYLLNNSLYFLFGCSFSIVSLVFLALTLSKIPDLTAPDESCKDKEESDFESATITE